MNQRYCTFWEKAKNLQYKVAQEHFYLESWPYPHIKTLPWLEAIEQNSKEAESNYDPQSPGDFLGKYIPQDFAILSHSPSPPATFVANWSTLLRTWELH